MGGWLFDFAVNIVPPRVHLWCALLLGIAGFICAMVAVRQGNAHLALAGYALGVCCVGSLLLGIFAWLRE